LASRHTPYRSCFRLWSSPAAVEKAGEELLPGIVDRLRIGLIAGKEPFNITGVCAETF
jgi:hypothetical protein